MTAAAQPDSIAMSRAYWIHKVEAFPSPVAQFRMAQLVDLDDRLYENARIVYRFLVGWYHDGHGDALLSMRHVSKVMRARAPDGVAILSHSVVQRAVIALMETGWVVRTYKGRGKGRGASRFVPVMNVLELASQGRLPQLSHSGGTVQLSHSGGTVVSHPNGTVNAELSHANGPKTLLRDPPTGGATERDIEPAPATPPLSVGLTATDAGSAGGGGGFDELWGAYGHRQKKADAKAAYVKAAPDADLHVRMVEAAKAWFVAWAAQGNAEAPRFTLAKWIEREEFECDPPTAFKPKEKKAKPAPPACNDNDDDDNDGVPDFMRGSPKLWPIGRHEGEFTDGDIVPVGGGDIEARMMFRRSDGKMLEHRFFTKAFIAGYEEEGNAYLRAIIAALGERDVEDIDNLLYKPLVVHADGSTLKYLPPREAA